jgi:CheY-like chemotaxis protein
METVLASARAHFLDSVPARLARVLELILESGELRDDAPPSAELLFRELHNLTNAASTLGFDALSLAARRVQYLLRRAEPHRRNASSLLGDPAMDVLIGAGMDAPLALASRLHAKLQRCGASGLTRILLVATDADMLAALASMLGLAGFDAVALRDSRRLRSVVASLTPAVVVFDCDLPEAEILALLARPDAVGSDRGPALLALVSGVDDTRRQRWMDAGADGVADKSTSIDALIAEIDQLLMVSAGRDDGAESA